MYMNRNENQRLAHSGLLLFILAAVLLLPWLGCTLYHSKGEPREALVAVNILASGDWILPLGGGTDMPYKPPVLAWLTAVFAVVFNGGVVNEYISRLPSALAGIALVMGTFQWARRIRGDVFALVLGMVVLTCSEVFRAATAARVDMVLTAAMVWALYVFFRIQTSPRSPHGWRWVAATLLLGVATLTKGPVGALLPCLVAGIFFLLRGERFWPTLLKFSACALGAFAIAAPWYLAAYARGGEQFMALALEENIGRLTGTMTYESHNKPFWYNFMTLAAGLLPWTLTALLALPKVRGWRMTPLNPAGGLALVACVAVFVFYCIPSSKRSVYLLPMYPFAAYFLTDLLTGTRTRPAAKVMAWILSALAIAVPVMTVVSQWYTPDGLPKIRLGWYYYIVAFVPAAAGAAWILRRRDAAVHSVLAAWAMYLFFASAIAGPLLNGGSDRRLVPLVPAEAPAIYTYSPHDPHYRPYTLNFYLGDKIRKSETLDVGSLPVGAVVLVPESPGLPPMPRGLHWYRLTDRSCDHRGPLLMGVKEP